MKEEKTPLMQRDGTVKFLSSILSIIIGLDHLNWKKCLAMTLVFTGVWIVNQSRAATIPHQN